MYIIGISAYYHDSAAVILKDEEIIAAAQEERFTRKKNDQSFPINALKFCLKEAGVDLNEIDYIAFYDKPFIKFERLLMTYLAEAPKGVKTFIMAIPIWLKEKLFLKNTLIKEFSKIGKIDKKTILSKILFSEHHQAHSSSAFFPSPFNDSAIITVDGVGEWTTTSIAHGKGNKIEFFKEISFPHSIGLLYSAFTYYLGFKVNNGEYKVMGLAPYGEPKYVKLIKDKLIDIKEDGSFRLNMKYFNYTTGLTMTNKYFNKLFGSASRIPETKLEQKHMDIARSIQAIVQEIMLKLVKFAKKETGSKNLCLAGGVALNCVANGEILRSNIFDRVWVQPSAGDAGGALGAAYSAYYMECKKNRTISNDLQDKMKGALLGPKYSQDQILSFLDKVDAKYKIYDSKDKLVDTIASLLEQDKVVGWHQGRMEFGPRALGARSILGDARSESMQRIMNQKIKFRESFRPFAPSVLYEKSSDYFEIESDSPYMLFVSKIKENKKINMTKEQKQLFGMNKLKIKRSDIPAVTHVDYSARLQTVHKETNAIYYKLLQSFEKRTGYALLVNTSFNVRGEPIVCSPQDSYNCFMRTEMDILVIENIVLYKTEQL